MSKGFRPTGLLLAVASVAILAAIAFLPEKLGDQAVDPAQASLNAGPGSGPYIALTDPPAHKAYDPSNGTVSFGESYRLAVVRNVEAMGGEVAAPSRP